MKHPTQPHKKYYRLNLNYRLFLLISLTTIACNKKEEPQANREAEVFVSISTDKARYNPGESVTFNAKLSVEAIDEIIVTYHHLGSILKTETLAATGSSLEWNWLPPMDDFKGYGISLVAKNGDKIIDYGSSAVDVSSDWTKFPRYGFLSKFGPSITSDDITQTIRFLNEYHINGLQYYDWHYKHHRPLKLVNGIPATSWSDIAKRTISFSIVSNYIAAAKEMNMASMSYNLMYGALEDYADDGVADEWLVYNDRNHASINKHDLDNNWALSDILVTDPSNQEWQKFIFDRTDSIYQFLDFNGWHLDQLGDRGTVYDYNGISTNLKNGFTNFLTALNERFPDKKMVFNAVNQYGQAETLTTPVDFSYTEVWYPNESYAYLSNIIGYNRDKSTKNTVVAAYMNYDLADQKNSFNAPAVLMTDAIIFALGGAHIELGEHMLGKEYFPNNNLTMSSELKDRLIEYYDIAVSYQNILRDEGILNLEPNISSSDLTIRNWPPLIGQVAALSHTSENKTLYHFFNFDGLSHGNWRDADGTQTAPNIQIDFEVSIPINTTSKALYISPDWHDGVPQELGFEIKNGSTGVTIPYLEYWGMILIN